MKLPTLTASSRPILEIRAMKKHVLVLGVIVLLFSGCAKRGEYVPVRSNDDFKAAFIFEIDGVKVYRFIDNGHYHYFAVRNTAAILDNGKASYIAGTIPEAVE
jgi:hypothetical protein